MTVSADRKLTQLEAILPTDNRPRCSTAAAQLLSRRTQVDHYGNDGQNSADVFPRQAVVA